MKRCARYNNYYDSWANGECEKKIFVSNIQINCSKNMTLTSCLWYSAGNVRHSYAIPQMQFFPIANRMHFVWMRPLFGSIQCKWRLDIFIFCYFSVLYVCLYSVSGPGFYLWLLVWRDTFCHSLKTNRKNTK